MKTEDLEHEIRALPQRSLPDAWRAAILRNARSEAQCVDERKGWWPQWLTPGCASAGALVATWGVIFAMNAGSGSNTPRNGATPADVAAFLHHLEQQQRMLAESPVPASAPEPTTPPLGDCRSLRLEPRRFS